MSILIAGIGNIFFGDDAFGSEVARRLMRREFPPSVVVRDFGIRGLDLAYAMLDGNDLTILVDATERGAVPGTLYLIEPDLSNLNEYENQTVDAHTMDPVKVIAMVKSMGGSPGKVRLVGCEPATLDSEDGSLRLSAQVAAAVAEAVRMVETLVEEHLANTSIAARSVA